MFPGCQAICPGQGIKPSARIRAALKNRYRLRCTDWVVALARRDSSSATLVNRSESPNPVGLDACNNDIRHSQQPDVEVLLFIVVSFIV